MYWHESICFWVAIVIPPVLPADHVCFHHPWVCRYSITGDCLEVGSGAPPKAAAVIFDSKLSDFRGSQLLMKPKGYSLIWQDTQGRKEKRLAVYRPIPESGYVAMGYVAVVGKNPPSVDLVRWDSTVFHSTWSQRV